MKIFSKYNSTSTESFVVFYNQCYVSLCYYANRYIKDPLVSEDIVSDVALKVWEKRGDIKNEAALKAYFYTAIRNACINFLASEKTSKRRKAQYVSSIELTEAPFTEQVIRTETLHQLEIAINSLPTQCRHVFIKLFKEGKSLGEAAEEMGLSIFTVKAQRQRGIKLLRERFAASGLPVLLSLCLVCYMAFLS